MKIARYLLFLILLMPYTVFGGMLKGRVTDEKGASLPYSTIFVEGTTMGVNANGNGDFELVVAPGLYKVVCQYIGYKQSTFNLSISGNETVTHTFVLHDQSLEMKEVVIHANTEDPAYRIIRNAIKRRGFHLKQVKSFQTGIYLKGVARSRKMPDKVLGKTTRDDETAVDSVGKGVLYLAEEDADYYSEGGKDKTIIHSVHESGNNNGLGFSQFPSVITFYENNVEMLGKSSRGFLSPIGDNALFYYKYKLLGEFTEQGHTIYKIKVMQKRNYEPCFNGMIYIVDSEWAIHSLNMTLVKESGLSLMDTLKVDQLFLPLKKDTWVIKSQLIYFTVDVLGFDITASGVTVYNNQKVNEPIPESVFEDKIVSAYDKTANKKDSSYWTKSRPVPLEQDEVKDFVVKDSITKRVNAPEYIDSVRRRNNRIKPIGLLLTGRTWTGKENKNIYRTNPVVLGLFETNMFNYNIVEGLNLSPKVSWRHTIDTGKWLVSEVAVRYGFTNHHFNTIARVYYQWQDRTFLNRSWVYGAEGGQYVFQYNPDNPVLPWFTTYADLFFRQNDLKLYERADAAVFVRRNYGTGLTWFVKASYQRRTPLQNTTDYTLIKGNMDGFASNTPTHLLETATKWEQNDAALLHITIAYKPGYTYTQYPDYKTANGSSWPTFTLNYEKGVPGVGNSVSDFDKWRFSIEDEVRLRLLGSLKYNVAAGGFLNTNYVSIPDLMHLYGNRGLGYASPYLQSFQFAQFYDFSNKEKLYYEAHAEYHLKGLLSNKIPLMRQARFYLLVGGNAFYASPTNYYAEAFAGVDNIGWKILRPLRIDFVQSWDSRMGRNSGIRFGLSFPGVTVNKNNVSGSEW